MEPILKSIKSGQMTAFSKAERPGDIRRIAQNYILLYRRIVFGKRSAIPRSVRMGAASDILQPRGQAHHKTVQAHASAGPRLRAEPQLQHIADGRGDGVIPNFQSGQTAAAGLHPSHTSEADSGGGPHQAASTLPVKNRRYSRTKFCAITLAALALLLAGRSNSLAAIKVAPSGGTPATISAPVSSSAPATVAAPNGVASLANEDIRDIRPPYHIPPGWLWLAWVAGGLILVVLGYGAWRWRQRLGLRVKLPYEIALEQLEAARRLMQPEQARAFSIAVSEIVRSYIEVGFEVRAAHRTTEEFLRDLATQPDSPLVAHQPVLADFLKHCDLAKFARWVLSGPQMEAMLQSAAAFIVATGKPVADRSPVQFAGTTPPACSPERPAVAPANIPSKPETVSSAATTLNRQSL